MITWISNFFHIKNFIVDMDGSFDFENVYFISEFQGLVNSPDFWDTSYYLGKQKRIFYFQLTDTKN